jgi:hypothetical protein
MRRLFADKKTKHEETNTVISINHLQNVKDRKFNLFRRFLVVLVSITTKQLCQQHCIHYKDVHGGDKWKNSFTTFSRISNSMLQLKHEQSNFDTGVHKQAGTDIHQEKLRWLMIL